MALHAPIRRGLAAAAVAGAALLPLAACQPGTPVATVALATTTATEQPADQTTDQSTSEPSSTAGSPTSAAPASTPATAPTPTPTATTSPVPTFPGGKGAGGPGSESVVITSPVSVSGHIDSGVSCQTAGAHYVASASGTVHGYSISNTVVVTGYHGAGTYPALVTFSVAVPDTHYAVNAVPTTVQITDSGGEVSFSATTDGGRTLAGSIVWACPV
ncbi:hypothetical protein BCD48_40695 [Pseudofrankia sp. BMG5.36]|nr:hypothetical protein BCD48_40695 [Pseudofrankia sp. BMG5.36]